MKLIINVVTRNFETLYPNTYSSLVDVTELRVPITKILNLCIAESIEAMIALAIVTLLIFHLQYAIPKQARSNTQIWPVRLIVCPSGKLGCIDEGVCPAMMLALQT